MGILSIIVVWCCLVFTAARLATWAINAMTPIPMSQRTGIPVRRSRWQVSLKQAFILFVLVGVFCAYLFKPLGQKSLEQRIVGRIEEIGVAVKLHQKERWKLTARERFLSQFYPGVTERVFSVEIPSQLDKPLMMDHIKSIASLPYLSNITIDDVGMTDEMLEELSRCQSLQVVTFDASADSRLTTNGMRCFENHPNISYFQVLGTKLHNDDYRAILKTLPSVPVDQVEGKVRRRVMAHLPVVFQSPRNGTGSESKSTVGLGVTLGTVPEVIDRLKMLDGLNCHIKISLWNTDVTPELVEELSHLEDLRRLGIADARESAGVSDSQTPELYSNLVPLQQLEHLSCECRVLPEKLDSLALLRSLKTLELKSWDIRDQDLIPLIKAPKLKVLKLPHAIITSRGLEIFAEAGMCFETLQLPATFQDMKQTILDSGLAQQVEFGSESPDSDPTNFRNISPFPIGSGDPQTVSRLQSQVDYIRDVIKDHQFPKPADSPNRPEDYMLSDLRRHQLELARKVGDAEASIDIYKRLIAGSMRARYPLERLISDPVAWRHNLKNEIPETDRLVRQAMRSLVHMELARENFDKALEWYVRSDMAFMMSGRRQQPERFEIDLAISLCQNCSEKMHHLRDYIFTVPEGKDEVRIEKASSISWYQFPGRNGRPAQAFVCILAPSGKRLVKMTADHDRLRRSRLVGETHVREMPDEVTYTFINIDSFPLTVTTSDLPADGE